MIARRSSLGVAGVAVAALVAGCSSTDVPPADAGGGHAGTAQGGTGASGGAGAGASGGSAGSAGAVTGGSAGTGAGGSAGSGTAGAGMAGAGSSAGGASGAGASGGAAGGGTAGAAASAGAGGAPAGAGGMAGAGMAGQAGSSAGAGGSGGGGSAVPSAGCARMAPRPSGGVVTVANDHIYTFPASYDGTTPMPLMFGFHANGNPINQIQNLTNGSVLETAFVRAFPKSTGSGWNYNTDLPRVRANWDELLEDYCIDTSRIFATGHSSGAQMIVQMLCGGETRFRAVAPVAASRYCQSHPAVAVLYIQGQMDAQRGNSNGADVVQVFQSSNQCSSTTMPKTDVAGCRSSFDNMQVTPGCVTYAGCSVPTHWCSHNDNGYNSTDGRQHGWPCFGSSAIGAFFQSF